MGRLAVPPHRARRRRARTSPAPTQPFVVDIGRAGGHTVAVYARDGVLYQYDFADAGSERRLLAGTAGSVSGDRLVFTRGNAIYERRGSAAGRKRLVAQATR